ncbi:energy-coupling factor transporter transmembrane protein EcfT [uncultured Phascolarctobacterium sp.]|jgi:energy-coupling factor transport system permease protein|uniref:energy-coupling factor transporter transmembrane component T family protein n=1 Tax=uncultured Phascolarctobacterium sp. TaxID=512296 RepID=UPI0025E1CA4F|nr:energy-coupling factor transporter transmembrane component T [uncultured Phascolarctobacterium sp.]
MSARQLWEGTDAASWAQRLNGRTKLLVLFLFAILMITVDNPRTLFVLFSFTLLLHIVARTSIYKWKVLAVLLLLGLWGSMFSQALFYAQTPRSPLFVIISPEAGILGQLTGGLYVYREGILYGAVQGLRSASMLTLGLLVCWTSDPRQLLQAMLAWRLSPQLAFMLVTAIRFLPVLAAETGEIITALQLRSDSQRGRTAVLRHLPYIAKPLLARCLRRAQTLALSVVSRGFFLAGARKRKEVWALSERSACAALAVLVVAVVSSKLVYLLSEQGFYFGVFRQIYDWTVLYL